MPPIGGSAYSTLINEANMRMIYLTTITSTTSSLISTTSIISTSTTSTIGSTTTATTSTSTTSISTTSTINPLNVWIIPQNNILTFCTGCYVGWGVFALNGIKPYTYSATIYSPSNAVYETLYGQLYNNTSRFGFLFSPNAIGDYTIKVLVIDSTFSNQSVVYATVRFR
jgi:hypothetical protein